MKNNTKSSITLPPSELELVQELMKTLKVSTKVEIIRRGLYLLKETSDKKALRAAFKKATQAISTQTKEELSELDHLSSEGLD